MLVYGVVIDAISPWLMPFSGEGTTFATSLIFNHFQNDPSVEQGDNRTEDLSHEFEWVLAARFSQPRKMLGDASGSPWSGDSVR